MRKSDAFYRKVAAKRKFYELEVHQSANHPQTSAQKVQKPYMQLGAIATNADTNDVDSDGSESESEPEVVSGDCADSGEDEPENANLCDMLATWATEFRIPHTALNALSDIVNNFVSVEHKLPKDARTLMRTPCTVQVVEMDGGQFWYYGVGRCISDVAATVPSLGENEAIRLTFNMDGLPIYGSSKKSFWPILMRIPELHTKALVVAVWCGVGKPAIRK